MVSASRCNLLSRSLPNYQKEVLGYSDTVANEFHNLLVDLRTHHHHQYKVRRVLEEIRDLEADELPFNDQPGEDGDEFSSLKLPELNQERPLFDGDDDPLLDLGALSEDPDPRPGKVGRAGNSATNSRTGDRSGVSLEDLRRRQEQKVQEPFRRVGDPFSFEEVAQQAGVKDLVLGGIEAELQELQNEVLNPRETSAATSQTTPTVTGDEGAAATQGGAKESQDGGSEDVDELLKLADDSLTDDHSPLSTANHGEVGSSNIGGQDKLVSDWDDFSSFMPATLDRTTSPLSGWEKELMDSAAVPSLDSILTPSIAQDSPPMQQDSALSTHTPGSALVTNSSSSTTVSPPPVSASTSEPPSGPLPPNYMSTGSDKGVTSSSLPDISVDELLGLGGGSESADKVSSGTADELLLSELQSLGLSPPKFQNVPRDSIVPGPTPQGSTPSSGLTSIDHTLFQLHSAQSQFPPTTLLANSTAGNQVSPFRSPLGMSQCPPVFPTQGAMGMVMAPPKFGLVSPAMQAPRGVVSPAQQHDVGGAAKGEGGKEGEKGQKGTAWMNFFAHLDPLVNEKA